MEDGESALMDISFEEKYIDTKISLNDFLLLKVHDFHENSLT
jgi:hypothetical protein